MSIELTIFDEEFKTLESIIHKQEYKQLPDVNCIILHIKDTGATYTYAVENISPIEDLPLYVYIYKQH